MSQTLEALSIANTVRLTGVRERRALIGRPLGEIREAIINPSEGLGRMRLRHVFLPVDSSKRVGLVPSIGPVKMQRAFLELSYSKELGRRIWHGDLRLVDLTEKERRALADAVIAHAPRSWRESGS